MTLFNNKKVNLLFLIHDSLNKHNILRGNNNNNPKSKISKSIYFFNDHTLNHKVRTSSLSTMLFLLKYIHISLKKNIYIYRCVYT